MSNKFCNICQNYRVKKSQMDNKIDMIERTTSCRLIIEEGAVLKVNEIRTEVDEDSRRKNMKCFCKVSSSEIIDNFESKVYPVSHGGSSKKMKECLVGKKNYKLCPIKAQICKIKNDSISQKLPRKTKKTIMSAEEEFKKFLRDSRDFKEHLHEIDEACMKKFCKIVKPKWFVPFTSKQISLLNHLPSAIEDDVVENVLRRTKQILCNIGSNPMFPDPDIYECIKLCKNNAVILLSDLLKKIKMKNLSVRKQSYEYFPNEHILMSAICWFELPIILAVLINQLPAAPPIENSSYLDKSEIYSCGLKNEKNPYLQPVFTNEPHDWMKQRRITELKRIREGAILRRRKVPVDVKRSYNHLGHIEFPPLINENGDYRAKSPSDLCCVIAAFQQHKKSMENHPIIPPTSRKGRKNCSQDKVSNVLMEVLNRLEGLNTFNYKNDHENSLNEVMGLLSNFGVVSASFPDLEHHPVVLQLIKHIKSEEVSSSQKKVVLKKALAANYCLRELYSEHRLDVPKLKKSITTWAYIDGLKKKLNMNRQIFLSDFFNCRLKNSINFYYSLNPCFLSNSFEKTFFAYMPSPSENVNFWPNKIEL